MPVWIISSAQNDAAIGNARRQSNGLVDITTLFKPENEGDAYTLLRALCDIDEHHGAASGNLGYDEVLIFGEVTEVLTPGQMQELGLTRIRPMPGGFVISKPGRITERTKADVQSGQ
jgi:hypothetical protein